MNQTRKQRPPSRKNLSANRMKLALLLLAGTGGLALVGLLIYGVAGPTHPPKPDPQRLVGRWQRTDGDYALEVQTSSPDEFVVRYFNPGPIHVARSKVERTGAEVQLFVELQDVGYPGSTYHLAYDSTRDLLRGVYVTKATHDTYEVMFRRE